MMEDDDDDFDIEAISSASESDDERGAEEEGGQGSERWSKGRIDEEEEIGDFVIRATTSV